MTFAMQQDLLSTPRPRVTCRGHDALKGSVHTAPRDRFAQLLTDHLETVGWNAACLDEAFQLLRENSGGATCA